MPVETRKEPFPVAAIQMRSSDCLRENLDAVERLVEEAVLEHRAGLILLPENFALFDGGAAIELGEQEADSSGVVRTFIAELARDHACWIVAGSIPSATRPDGSWIGGRVRSACRVFDSRGVEVSRYDKIHLFDVDVGDNHDRYRESSQFEAGATAQTVDTPVGKVGLSICYDLRFAALYSFLAEAGAEIFTVPAAFTYKTGAAHWEILLRARAIENQCYVMAANQAGVHSKGRETWGDSMIVDPWGEVIARAGPAEGVVSAGIDLSKLAAIRKAMPVFEHRRI